MRNICFLSPLVPSKQENLALLSRAKYSIFEGTRGDKKTDTLHPKTFRHFKVLMILQKITRYKDFLCVLQGFCLEYAMRFHDTQVFSAVQHEHTLRAYSNRLFYFSKFSAWKLAFLIKIYSYICIFCLFFQRFNMNELRELIARNPHIFPISQLLPQAPLLSLQPPTIIKLHRVRFTVELDHLY